MKKYPGRCHCGQITYMITGDPTFQLVCYCRDCQHLNAGGRLCGVLFERKAIQIVGQTTHYDYPGGSGGMIESHFCPHCGTRLFHFPEKYPHRVVVQVNTLNHVRFQPQRRFFQDGAFSWDVLLDVEEGSRPHEAPKGNES